MANDERKNMLKGIANDLLQVAANALAQSAKDAFYRFRDGLIEQMNVSSAERDELLDWIGAERARTPVRSDPPMGRSRPGFELGERLNAMPDVALVLPDEQVWQLNDTDWYYVDKKMSMTGNPEPGSGWHVVYPIPTTAKEPTNG